MKHIEHKQRKSFKKWAMPNQYRMTETKHKIEIQRAASKKAGRNYSVVGRNGYKETRPQANGLYQPLAFVTMHRGFDTIISRNCNRGVKPHSVKVASKGLVYSSTKNQKGFQSKDIKPTWKYVEYN